MVAALVLALAAVACDDAAPPSRPDAADAAPGDVGPADAPVEAARNDATEVGSNDAVGEVASNDAAAVDAADAPPGGDAGPDVSVPPLAAKLDLLFVVDNSSSMLERQQGLAAAMPNLLGALAALPGGLPDLHVGVISSNVGAGISVPAPECPQGGDQGTFQSRPECASHVSGRQFVRLARDGSGNLTSGATGLPAALACLVNLGNTGCGYEHHLASLAFALGGANPANVGFLRDDALLAIVILADEDDCSGEPTATFYQDQIMFQAGSVRCALRGHVCGGQPLPAAVFSAPLSTCAPYVRGGGERDTRLIDVSAFVAAVTAAKKGHAERIFASVIAGWSDEPGATYTLVERPGRNGGTEIDSGAICRDAGGRNATAALRLRAFANAFANHGMHSICGDIPAALTSIGQRVAALLAP